MKKCLNGGGRNPDNYHRGDGLVECRGVDIENNGKISDILGMCEQAGFGARRLGEGARVLENMCRDPNCFRVLTLSGAMTVAQMGLIIELLVRKWFHAVVSTGALMTHGLVQSIGRSHFKAPSGVGDQELYQLGLNRVYDTLEPETNLDYLEEVVHEILDKAMRRTVWSSHKVLNEIGRHLDKRLPQPAISIARTAYRQKVPIFIPAFTDSELGLDVGIMRIRDREKGRRPISFNEFLDLEHYTELVFRAVSEGKSLGIFTIGGGVPRNWAQQVGPYLDIRTHRLGKRYGALARFKYGVRICNAPEHEGGLSGCSYAEGESWGKFVPLSEGGMRAELFTDATYVLPFLVRGVWERLR